MKLSVFAVLLQDKSFDEACAYLASKGVQAVEIGCGGFPGDAHCKPLELLNDETKLQAFKDTLARHHLDIAALSVHGNAVHPDKAVAEKAHTEFENAVLLAEKLGVETVVTFSGCPGGCPEDKTPNWVTCPWPDDYHPHSGISVERSADSLLEEGVRILPRAHGVRVAFEMHPGFCVYNPETMMRHPQGRAATTSAPISIPATCSGRASIPWPPFATWATPSSTSTPRTPRSTRSTPAINGVLDTKPYADEIHRSWIFRSVGYGHAHQVWKDMMSALRMVGYDGLISIEHEDSLMTPTEGLNKGHRHAQGRYDVRGQGPHVVGIIASPFQSLPCRFGGRVFSI